MRLLVFTDVETDFHMMGRLKRLVLQHKPDLAVCCGDITFFGSQLDEMLDKFNDLGVHVVVIHGNHEEEELTSKACEIRKNLTFVHGGMFKVKGLQFFGWGGHGFRRREPVLEELEKKHASEFTSETIVLSHAPPYGTSLDQIEPEWHVGNESLTELIKRRKPMLVLCGHIHECFHHRDSVAGTMIINPGPDGEIIEVEE